MTWEDLKQAVRDVEGRAVQRSDGSLELNVVFDSGNEQTVLASSRSLLNTPWCEIESLVVEATSVDPEEMLKRNADLHTGAVCIKLGHYVVRQALPVSELDAQQLLRLMKRVAGSAQYLQNAFLSM